MAKKDSNFISARESRKISKANAKITRKLDKKLSRKHVPETEYLTKMHDDANVVEFDDLHTCFFTDVGTVKAVDGVSFNIPVGKTVGVVGESGCGKSVTSLSLMQLLQRPTGQIVSGEIRLNLGDKAYDVTKMPIRAMEKIRGNVVSMIFQEPMTSLNPDGFYRMKFDYAVEDSPSAFRFFDPLPELKVLVFDRPWNRECEFPREGFTRCPDWKTILGIVG